MGSLVPKIGSVGKQVSGDEAEHCLSERKNIWTTCCRSDDVLTTLGFVRGFVVYIGAADTRIVILRILSLPAIILVFFRAGGCNL
jgi:hypothetical protein